MTSALLATVLLVCAAAAIHDFGAAAEEPSSSVDSNSESAEKDGERYFAPFMIVVEHSDEWRCAGSLVSLRTALTSAWCARGRGPGAARELWALAASAAAAPPRTERARAARLHGARRVARVAVATGADAEVSDGTEPSSESWRGGAMDLALIELEEPFGSSARARPILMATSSGECAASSSSADADVAQCHVSRALPRTGSRRTRLLIVSAEIAAPERCDRAADHWNVVRDRALCLVGPELCASDWGSGVVCGGKLCGVLSRSVRAEGGGEADDCGDVHAAQSVSLWRRFLHCAHTLRACGSDGDCVDLCVERRLVEEPQPPPASLEPSTDAASSSPTSKRSVSTTEAPSVFFYPTHTSRPRGTPGDRPSPTRSGTPRAAVTAVARGYSPLLARSPAPAPASLPEPVATGEALPSLRPSFEFEPNRADFKAASAPSRSTRAYLKAGEYGDNAADYGGEEAPAPTRTPAPSPSPPGGVTAVTQPPDAPPAERRAAPAHDARDTPRAPASASAFSTNRHPLAVLILLPFIYITTTM